MILAAVAGIDEMKRRGFLGLLGLAPAVPLIAKELAKGAPTSPPPPERTVRIEKYVDHVCMVTAGHWVSTPSRYSGSYSGSAIDEWEEAHGAMRTDLGKR